MIFSSCGTNNVTQYYFDKLGGGLESSVEIDPIDTTAVQTDLKSAVENSLSKVSSLNEFQELEDWSNVSWFDTSSTISAEGTYYITGNVSNIKIKKNMGNVHLYLVDCNVTAAEYEDDGEIVNNAILCNKGNNLIISLVGTNTISNYVSESSAEDNAIRVKGNLVVNGSGSLEIKSTKSAINVNETFYGLGGNVTIVSAQNHGISADSIYLDGINLNINHCGKDGLHAESDYDKLSEGTAAPEFDYSLGFIYIAGDTILNITNCYGDGIQADSFVYIAGGTISVSTVPDFVSYTATSNGEKGCYSQSGNTYTKVSSDNVKKGSTYYKLSESVKAIKVGEIDYAYVDSNKNVTSEGDVVSSNYTILIEGGTLTLSSADDSIHSNSGSVLVYGGKIDISTSDDGIHADTNLIIGGGSVNVSKSYEGLEGQTIEISGGEVLVVASDDGINAANSDLSTNAQKTTCQILISGGTTYVSSSGDGVDSNGGIKITGGELYIYGPTSSGDAALDSESGIIINGGTVVAVGASGMVETPSTSSTQCVISANLSSSKSGDVVVKDSSGTTLISFSPSSIFNTSKSYSSVVVSCGSFKKGQKYTITTGSTSLSITTNSSSTITTNGSSVGGPRR